MSKYPPGKHPGGRPTKYKKDFHPDDFIRQSKQGKNLAQISLSWDVDRTQLYDWAKRHPEFHLAIKKGREFAEAWYLNLGQLAMLNQAKIEGKPALVNLGFYVWLTKNIFKWSDNLKVEETDNTSKKELRKIVDLKEKTIEELVELYKSRINS